MSKRKLNQEIIEITHILMDTMQKQAKIEDTNQVLSSLEQEKSVISPLKSEDHQQNDCKVEKQAKIEDTNQVLFSFEQENGVISPQKSKDRRQNDCKVEKQAKTKDTQLALSSFEQENGVTSPQKSEYHQQNDCRVEKQSETYSLDTHQREVVVEQDEKVDATNLGTLDDEPMSMNDEENDDGQVIGPRERLKRHRKEVAGHVWIPDLWGQEDLLKDWSDCSAFDKCLVTHSIMSARASLIEEGRRANSTSLSVENSC